MQQVVSVVPVGPLDIQSINELIVSIMGSNKEKANALSKLVFNTTNGNPYFACQSIELLQREDMLVKTEDGEWSWDLEWIQLEINVLDNVVELICSKIEALLHKMKEVLELAAFMGFCFHCAVLHAVLDGPLDGSVRTLSSDEEAIW